jgi:4-alpha-glucanotransferase
VALDSADTWANPELFCLDGGGYPLAVAGVPPDYFSETGQLWGNPLYDWEAHKQNDYSWWVKRLQNALSTADVIRLDHFRGFESYWSVPYGEKTAVKGKWLKGPGKALFNELRDKLGGDLPIIAEDLGIITPAVERLRCTLGLPGMRVMQFGFDGSPKNTNTPYNFDRHTIAYTGTHDNDTTAGWYAEQTDEIRDRFRRFLNSSGHDPAWDMIRCALLSNADWAVLPIQDVLSLPTSARMNRPGEPMGNWRFRHTQADLTDELAARLKYMAELGGRNIKH